MSYEVIIKGIKKKEYAPIYFLDGAETYFIDEISNLLESQVLTEAEKGFNQMVIYGKETDCSTIINTAKRYPMMSQYQLVIVKEAQHLRNITELASYAENPLTSTVLVINYKGKKLDQRSKLSKAIKKNGHYFHSKPLYDNKIPSWIVHYLKKKKYPITAEAVSILAEYLGTDLSRIANELEKITINVEVGEEITPQLVEKFVGINRDYNFFEFQKALANREEKKVFRMVTYFGNNPKAAPMPVLMSNLYNFYRRLYLLHHHLSKSDQELQKILGLYSAFFVKEYKTAARFYNKQKTKRNLALLLKYDLKSKGVDQANNSHKALMQELAFQLMN